VTLSDMPLLGILRDRMSWLNARQTLLSQNVANADAPGYAARDLKPVDFESALKQEQNNSFSGLTTTNPMHIAISANGTSLAAGTEETEQETSPTGNSVSLEEEMIKVADTQAQYQAATNLYSKMVGMMRTAIGTP